MKNISHGATHYVMRGNTAHNPSEQKPKFLDQLREALRSRHYSPRTEQTYCRWVKCYIHFHNVSHLTEMAEPEINAFLPPSGGQGEGQHLDAASGAFSVAVSLSSRPWPRPKAPTPPRHYDPRRS